jgi:hypothetical protein
MARSMFVEAFDNFLTEEIVEELTTTVVGGNVVQALAADLGGSQCVFSDQLGTDQLAAKVLVAANGYEREGAVVEVDPTVKIGRIDPQTAGFVRTCQEPEDFLQRKNIEMPCQRHCQTPL